MEGGVWLHTTNANAFLATVGSPNRVVGTQTGTPTDNFNDSYGYLNGVWRPNVEAIATIYKDPTIDAVSGMHEVELLFRLADSADSVRCYECNFSSVGGYSNIVRWEGAHVRGVGQTITGDFSILTFGSTFTAPQTGDQVKARSVTVGGTVTLTSWIKFAVANGGDGLTWNQLAQITDTTWLDGAPGIGMWLHSNDHFTDEPKIGFSTYAVTEI